MYVNGDLLGDEGRKALDACVKVKIYGRPENLPKYHWITALEKLDKCYAGYVPTPDWMYLLPTNPRLLNDRLCHLMLPTEWDEDGNPHREKLFDIIEIHEALVNFDEMPYVERCPKGTDELKELIDKRRADVERECQEATANPDARIQYSWLVAQRRVRDCFAGSFAGDSLLVQLKRDPSEPYNIVDIHDAVVHWNEKSFFQFKCSACAVYFARSEEERRLYLEPRYGFHPEDKFWWKKHTAERDDVEREFKEATSTKVIKEYSRDEAELRVKNCYGYGDRNSFKFYVLDGTPILPIKRDDSGKVDQTYNIFDIHAALQQLDKRKLLQKYPDEGPGSDELRKSIEANNFRVKQEYEKATSELSRYSHSEAEKRVRDCFVDALPKEKVIFPAEEDETKEPCSNKTYDIFDIHRRLLYFDEHERNVTRKRLKCPDPSDVTEPEKAAKVQRDAVTKEYEQAKSNSRLHGYSRNEAERRARDCFAGTVLRTPGDTDIFPTKEEESGIPKTQQTYDIFDIKTAIVHFDKKKLRDRYLDEKDPDAKYRNKLADEKRAEIEAEYAKATEEMEIEHGSGFIIHDHFIVTNKHVIVDVANDKTKEICISNTAIDELHCEVIEDDGLKDLALLYCKDLNLKQNGVCPLQLSDQPLLPGMQIFSFGYPVSHKGKKAIFVNGYVSGSEETYSKLCLLGHTMAVLNCPLNPGNSGGPVLCLVNGQLKVVGVATQKHFKEILTLEERRKVEKIRESLQTCTMSSVPDDAIKHAAFSRESFYLPKPDPCQTPMFLLTLKLYDALETHSQFNLSNALPGHCVIDFIKNTIRKNKGEGKEELLEVIKWSESHENVLPSGHLSASKCCVQ